MVCLVHALHWLKHNNHQIEKNCGENICSFVAFASRLNLSVDSDTSLSAFSFPLALQRVNFCSYEFMETLNTSGA